MKIILKIAFYNETNDIQNFFSKYLKYDNDGIVNGEFLCPFGVEGAIKRKQVVILKYKNEIMGALRFYYRKRDNIVSLYQFALNEDMVGRGLIIKMLKKTGYKRFESSCFIDSNFNNYYLKSGWELYKTDIKFNYWVIVI